MTLEAANRVYVDNKFPLTVEFQSTLTDHFGAPPQNVDFQNNFDKSRIDINNWVENFTREKIKDVLPEGIFSILYWDLKYLKMWKTGKGFFL